MLRALFPRAGARYESSLFGLEMTHFCEWLPGIRSQRVRAADFETEVSAGPSRHSGQINTAVSPNACVSSATRYF